MIRFLSVLLIHALAFAAGDIAGVTAHIGGTNQGGYGAGGTTISAGDIQTDDDLTVGGDANITADISATNADFSGGTMTAGTMLDVFGTYVESGSLSLGKQTPTPSQAGTGGAIRLSGNGAAGYAGGAATMYAGRGGDAESPGNGGALTIYGGIGGEATGSGTGGTGGDLTLMGGYGGDGGSGGSGGNLILRGGIGGESGSGASGNVQIADDTIYLGLPNLSLPSYSKVKFSASTGGAAGGAALIQGANGSAGTSGAGGAGGAMVHAGGDGGAAASGSNANGGAGGPVYVFGGAGGRKDGSGTNGAAGSTVLAYNPLLTAATGGVAVCKAAPVAGVELDVGGDAAFVGGVAVSRDASNYPGYIKLYSANNTPYYLFVSNDGHLRIHNAAPTADGDGSVVGP